MTDNNKTETVVKDQQNTVHTITENIATISKTTINNIIHNINNITNNIIHPNSEIKSIPNPSNNPLITEINELLSDQESIKKRLITPLNNDFFELEVSISENIIQTQYPIKFLIKIPVNYPKEKPELFCITKFSYPHIFDGRDLLDDVIKMPWNSKIFLIEEIINKIPRFIIHFNTSLEDGYLLVVGKYIKDHLYEKKLINKMPVFSSKIKQKEARTFKSVLKPKLLTISDLSICLYEIVPKNQEYYKLSFHANLSDLATFKRNTQENLITLTFKNINDQNKTFDIVIKTEDTEEIRSILLEKMELFGKEYNISKKDIKRKMGKLPSIDIEKTEKKIMDLEKNIEIEKNELTSNQINQLMNLYQTAIEYYSAVNNPRYAEITQKIQNLLNSKQLKEFMEKPPEEKKERSNKKKTSKKEAVEKVEETPTPMAITMSKGAGDLDALDVGLNDEEEEEEEEEEENNDENKKDEKTDVKNDEEKKENDNGNKEEIKTKGDNENLNKE